MPKLIILRGNSASGKSTVAARLQHIIGRNTMLIPQDFVRREMLYARDGEDTPALPLMISLLEYAREHFDTAIIEGITKSDWYRPLFQKAQELYPNELYAYYFDIPFEETLRRHATRDKCGDFGEKEMREWWNDKDYLRYIPEKTITEDMSADDIINMILHDIGRDELLTDNINSQ